MKLEDSLNGGYAGLLGEVVTFDCYRLRSVPFIPDIVYDLGANVGVFARFAQELWPESYVVSVEPHPENIAVYKEHTFGTTLIEAAIGTKNVWHYTGAANGAHENYISEGIGFDRKDMIKNPRAEQVKIRTVSVCDIINETTALWHLANGIRQPKTVLKMDIEGAENSVFADEASMNKLRDIDYLAFEIHNYGETAEGSEAVKELTMRALESFIDTHHVWIDHISFWAIKKYIL